MDQRTLLGEKKLKNILLAKYVQNNGSMGLKKETCLSLHTCDVLITIISIP